MLFSDRLEIWNPGTLPPALTIKKLRKPHSSHPGNPLIAEPLFLTKYIEKAGTGTVDMYEHCRKAGIRPPEFRLDSGTFILTVWRKRHPDQAVTERHFKETVKEETAGQMDWDQVGTKLGLSRDQVLILQKIFTENSLIELMASTGRTNRTKFREKILNPMLNAGVLEMTIPDKPRSRLQKYRITAKTRALLSMNHSSTKRAKK